MVAPGAVIALTGGLLAAASLALCGLVNWTIYQVHAIADPALARALTDLSFAAGSAGFVAPLGLLVAGIAVPSLILGLLPARSRGPGWRSPRPACSRRSRCSPLPSISRSQSAGSSGWPG